QAAGTITYTWDNNGNLLTQADASGTITHTYDYANRLKTVTGTVVSSYAYDGDGLRVGRTVDGTTTNYLWDKALALPVIITDSNSLYLYGLGLIAQQQGTDIAYYHPDGLGSVRNLTNATGQGIASYAYDPFGTLKSATGSWPNDFRFTGQQLDQATGLYYLRARYYDPALGRFVSRDPIPGKVTDPRTLNPYGYAYGNPARYVDPDGQFAFLIPVAVWVLANAPAITVGATAVGSVALATYAAFTAQNVGSDVATLTSTDAGMPEKGLAAIALAMTPTDLIGAGALKTTACEIAEASLTAGIRAMRLGREAQGIATAAYRAEHTGDVIVAGRAIRDASGQTLKKAGATSRNYFPDAVNFTTGQVVEFKTGVLSDAATGAAKQQVTEYSRLLNEYSGSNMTFNPVVLWLDEAGNVIPMP
ncbi:MAG TPA: RHS repeat-associated core domain-containing protein, partial [Thermoleophilia bacterium]|nr:RHS repeat-associated core domain-containing protein [Thermoleophilia bacterium]